MNHQQPLMAVLGVDRGIETPETMSKALGRPKTWIYVDAGHEMVGIDTAATINNGNIFKRI